MALLIFYVFVCALVGVFGMRQRGGFLLYFLLALLFTPIIGFVVAFVVRLVAARSAAAADDVARERWDAQRPLA